MMGDPYAGGTAADWSPAPDGVDWSWLTGPKPSPSPSYVGEQGQGYVPLEAYGGAGGSSSVGSASYYGEQAAAAEAAAAKAAASGKAATAAVAKAKQDKARAILAAQAVTAPPGVRVVQAGFPAWAVLAVLGGAVLLWTMKGRR